MIQFAFLLLALAIFYVVVKTLIEAIPDFLNEIGEIVAGLFDILTNEKTWSEAWPSVGGTILTLLLVFLGEWGAAFQVFVSGLIVQLAYSILRDHFGE